jgi:hypothetical protein
MAVSSISNGAEADVTRYPLTGGVIMKSKVLVLLVVLSLVLIGCAGRKASVYQRQTVFIEEEYGPYTEAGTGSIVGQVFVETEDGETKYGSGSTIYLNPVTTYSTEWFNIGILQGKELSEADVRVWAYHEEAVADRMGNFRFTNLAPGEYYLATAVNWEIQGEKGSKTIGVIVGTRASVGEGETVDVVLTK